ncbi:MAG TPA: bifunctional diguanylate cyclase/phosphodiesterase, partial [Epsilonproteobacteria bacterium]|nr:bifunctional diguanylate cyclase/phosphodiesterase [Campylobacterota bacterium]
FKKVNETYGHDVGDHLLKQVVQRMENIVGSREIFARVSGNKFVILIPSLHMNEKESKEMTDKYIHTINHNFALPLNIAGEEYHLSFTIGVVLFNNNDASAFDVLKRAETAMYEAKKAARGTSSFYQTSMSNTSKEELTVENDIHKALKNNEFSIYYQPQLNIESNTIIGAEALVRWEHPTKGFIPPANFIPIAEESGIIIKLEEWIFNKAIEEVKILSETMHEFPLEHIAINVSTMHFLQPHFVEKLMLLIHRHKVNPEWIELEITESGIMRNINDAVQKIKELKAFGFTFSIDDFGTGYSSLAYLKELPVDMIKIDQSFVFSMNENKGDAMIVESVVALGKKFNFKVLAEGVENKEVLKHLSEIKCDYYQGNYASKPVDFDTFKDLIQSSTMDV